MTLQEVYHPGDLSGGGRVFRDLSPPARLCIFGDPVAQSASPVMQNAALRARGLELQYVRILVTEQELPSALHDLSPAGFLGASLTMPHKQAALSLMDKVSREAQIMGAINTVVIREGKLHGHNTDGPGFSAAVGEEFGVPLRSLRVLVLGGGGGAGRAITVQCILEGCPRVVVANRTPEKAALLAGTIARELPASRTLESVPLDEEFLPRISSGIDLIVNATPLGMKQDDPSPLPDAFLSKDHLVYDTVYTGGETALLRQARRISARYAEGFSMLLHQGILQNALWFGDPVPIEAMRDALSALRR